MFAFFLDCFNCVQFKHDVKAFNTRTHAFTLLGVTTQRLIKTQRSFCITKRLLFILYLRQALIQRRRLLENIRYFFYCPFFSLPSPVKGVNYFGLNSEYVVSGSDCGHVFLWDKESTEVVQYLKGDHEGVVSYYIVINK